MIGALIPEPEVPKQPEPSADRFQLEDPSTSSSKTDQELIDISFQQVQCWTQKIFTDLIPEQEAPARKYMSFAEAQLDKSSAKKQLLLLPWSEGVKAAKTQVQEILTPRGATSSFKIGKNLPTATSQQKYYKVRNQERASEAAILNPDLVSLTTGKAPVIKPSLTLNDDDLKAVESSAKRQLLVASMLDWHCATVGNIVNSLNVPEDGASVSSDTPMVSRQDLEAVKRVILAMSRSISQMNRESATLLANTTLKRRDGYLNALPASVSHDQKLQMRTTDVFSSQLFDSAQLGKTIEKTRQDATIQSSLKTVQLVDKMSHQTKTSTKKPWTPVYANDLPKGRGKGGQQQSQRKPSYQPKSYNKDNHGGHASKPRKGFSGKASWWGRR